jgi:transcriptional antiterminator RfaH
VKDNGEKKVAGYLSRKNIETYFPLNKTTTKNRYGTLSVVQTPLLPSLVFALISKQEINIVEQIDGVLHFLYWKSSYAIVSREDISMIRDFCNEYEAMWVEKCTVLREGHVDSNLPAGSKKIVFQSRNSSVTGIVLTTLGYMLAAFTRKEKVGLLHNAI